MSVSRPSSARHSSRPTSARSNRSHTSSHSSRRNSIATSPNNIDLDDEKENYIPLWLAHEKIGELLHEMNIMQEQHVEIVTEIKDKYDKVLNIKEKEYKKKIEHVKIENNNQLEEKERIIQQLQPDNDNKKSVEEHLRIKKLAEELQQRLDENTKKLENNEKLIIALRKQSEYYKSDMWERVSDNVISMIGENNQNIISTTTTNNNNNDEQNIQNENVKLKDDIRKLKKLLKKMEQQQEKESNIIVSSSTTNEESNNERILELESSLATVQSDLKKLQEEKLAWEEKNENNDEHNDRLLALELERDELLNFKKEAQDKERQILSLQSEILRLKQQQKSQIIITNNNNNNNNKVDDEKLKENENEFNEFKEKCESKKIELKELTDQLKEARETLRTWKPELTELGNKRKETSATYKKESESLKEKLTALGFFTEEKGKPSKSDLDGEDLEHYQKVGDLKKEKANLDKEYKSRKTEYENLHAQEKEWRQSIVDLQNEYQNMVKELEEKQKDLEVNKNDEENNTNENTNNDESWKAEAEVIQLRQELLDKSEKHDLAMKEKLDEINKLKKQLKKSKKQIKEVESKTIVNNEDETIALVEMQQKLDKVLEQKAKLETQVSQMMSDHSNTTTNNNNNAPILTTSTNNEELKELQNKLNEYENLNSQSQKDLKDLQNQLKKAKKELKQAHSSGDPVAMKKQITSQEREIKRLGEQAEKAKAQLEKNQGQIEKQLQSQFKADMVMKEKEFQQKLASMEKDLGKQLKKSQSQAEKLKKSFDETQEELKKLQDKHKELQNEHNTTTKEMNEMKDDLANGAEAIAQLKSMKEATEKMETELKTAQDALLEEQIVRKKLRNELEDLKGKIRVYCRCRPMNRREKELSMGECVRFPDPFTIILARQGTVNIRGESIVDEKQYEFDSVFAPGVNGSQEDVFEATRGLAQSACDGFNVCIFAYGQTGSGKTYTMAGEPDNEGLKPRFIRDIYDMAKKAARNFEFSISCSLIEIYLDKLQDLFWKYENKDNKNAKAPVLKIGKDARGVVKVKNAVIHTFDDAEAMLDYTNLAESVRKVGSTKMNAGSSRSHLIFSLNIARKDISSGKQYFGKLSLVDLAGSESVGKTGATKDRLREAQSINTSLSALAKVIRMLAAPPDKRPAHIPYRDNMLTRIMEDSLGGNAKTLMFVNISPSLSEFQESNSSLSYASIVKTITNDASAAAESKEIQRLKRIIQNLKQGKEITDDDDATETENEAKAG